MPRCERRRLTAILTAIGIQPKRRILRGEQADRHQHLAAGEALKPTLVNVAGHAFAGGATIVLVAAVPIVLYGALVLVGIIMQGDPGSPLNFILVPIGSLLLGLACAAAFVPISLIALQFGRAAILAPVAVAVLIFVAWELFVTRPGSLDTLVFHSIGAGLGLFVGLAFLVYLAVLLVSRKFLGLLTA